MARRLSLLVLALLLSSCASGNCCCPRNCAPACPRTVGEAAAPDPDLSGPAYDAAHKAWIDEIGASFKAGADCLFAAESETDPAARESKKAACLEQYRARAKANNETFERRKAEIEKRQIEGGRR